MTTSNKVAEVFGKNHKDVLRIIDSLDIPDEYRLDANKRGAKMNEPMTMREWAGIAALMLAFALSLVWSKIWGDKDSSDETKEG